MLKIKFEINGKQANGDTIADAIEAAAYAAVEEHLRIKLNGIRDPETGEFPVVAVRGSSLKNFSIEASGSPQLIALVNQRLSEEGVNVKEDHSLTVANGEKKKAVAFLCHASDDDELAERIARDLMTKGIDTFCDNWSIEPGQSVRQRIDEGLGACTHFIALITQKSINRLWVHAEIDAAFVLKMEGKCKFIALRHEYPAEGLPPLLKALLSPEIKNYEKDIASLINFIHGVSNKPILGNPPQVVQQYSGGKTGLSAAAEAIAKYLVEKSEHGDKYDPHIGARVLQSFVSLSDHDLVDGLDELEGKGYVEKKRLNGAEDLECTFVGTTGELFAKLDQHFVEWNPEEDALHIAAGLVNESMSNSSPEISERLGWKARRLNAAVHYLLGRDLIDRRMARPAFPWCSMWVVPTHKTRRFVKDRS